MSSTFSVIPVKVAIEDLSHVFNVQVDDRKLVIQAENFINERIKLYKKGGMKDAREIRDRIMMECMIEKLKTEHKLIEFTEELSNISVTLAEIEAAAEALDQP